MNIRAFDEVPEPRSPGVPVSAGDPGWPVGAGREAAPGAVAPLIGSPYEEPESVFDILKYWGFLLKHRTLIATGLAIALCLGFGVTYLTTPMYRTTATIQIDMQAQKVVNFRDDAGTASRISDIQFYQTEYALMKSRSLAERVVADLDLANQPMSPDEGSVSPWTKLRRLIFGGPKTAQPSLEGRKNAAIGHVMGGLLIQPVPNSALVHVSFDDANPAVAQKIVNAFSDAFIKSNLEHRYDATAYARNFLQDQIAQLKLKLEESERDLVAYAQKEQIVTLDEKEPALAAADLLAINSELARVRAERIKNEQLWHQAETTNGLGLPQILNDKSIQRLREDLASLRADYEDKLDTFKPDFPDMKQIKAKMNELNRQIQEEVTVVKQSIEATYEASKQQEVLLVQQLKKNTNQVLDVQNRNIEYTILKREVDTNRTLYDALLQRYKDVGVDSGVGTNNISVVDPALPGYRFSPSLSRNLSLALIFGLVGSAAVAYLLEVLDNTFKTPEEVEETLRLPVLGLTPLLTRNTPVEEAMADPHSALSEAFRSVRTALQFSTDDGVPKSLLVTSSHPSEGKSTTSLALARNFAQLSLRVLLVDADLRKPSLHKTLGCDNSVGLSNYLVGSDATSGVFRKTETPGLTFMASGPLPPNPAELLSGPKLLSLLTFAHQKFDLIILDGPPIMGIADALLLASAASGTLMVVGACETPKEVVKRAMKRLHFARARMIGLLLSKFDAKKVGFGYGYGYGYSYGDAAYYSYGKDTPKLAPAPGE